MGWPSERRQGSPASSSLGDEGNGCHTSLLAGGTGGCRLAVDTAWVEDVYTLENCGLRGQWEDGAEGWRDPQCLGAAHRLSMWRP